MYLTSVFLQIARNPTIFKILVQLDLAQQFQIIIGESVIVRGTVKLHMACSFRNFKSFRVKTCLKCKLYPWFPFWKGL